MVMASGNSSGKSPIYPAAYASEFGVAVGAVDESRQMTWFSNRAGDSEISYVTAPGALYFLHSWWLCKKSGTSMAAPIFPVSQLWSRNILGYCKCFSCQSLLALRVIHLLV